MNVTLGSLLNEHLQALQELNLLPEEADSQDKTDDTQQPTTSGAVGLSDGTAEIAATTPQSSQPVTRTQHSGRTGSLTWFEELLDGSRLGRTQNTGRGIGVSNDGSTRVEWQVSEYYDDGTDVPQTSTSSKRKIADVGKDDGDDVSMQH